MKTATLLIIFSTCFMLVQSYDYYVFAVEWAGSVCATKSCAAAYIQGIDPTFMNMHGLWPSSFSGKDPENCPGPAWDPS